MKAKEFSRIAILIGLYVLIGNARSVQQNPFIPGATVAVNMVVPVLAGIFFGRKDGMLVGLFGTFLNALSPAGSAFEYLSIVPHGAMGYLAGSLKGHYPPSLIASTLVAGHFLNIAAYSLFGALPRGTLSNASFWYGIAYESVAGIIGVIMLTTIFRLAFPKVFMENE